MSRVYESARHGHLPALANEPAQLVLHALELRPKPFLRIRPHAEEASIRGNRSFAIAGERRQPSFFARDPRGRDCAVAVVVRPVPDGIDRPRRLPEMFPEASHDDRSLQVTDFACFHGDRVQSPYALRGVGGVVNTAAEAPAPSN